jgi:hypothetical protein
MEINFQNKLDLLQKKLIKVEIFEFFQKIS